MRKPPPGTEANFRKSIGHRPRRRARSGAFMKLVIREGWYYSQGDEDAFYGRLNSLPCVKSIRGHPYGIQITLRPPSEWQLRELLSLLFRYGLDMAPLAALKTER